MTRSMPISSLLIAFSLVGCGDETTVSERSAIQLEFTGEAADIRDAVTEFLVVVDHEVPYDIETTRINTEWMDLRDYDEDGDIDLILTVNLDRAEPDVLPSLELRPGANTSAFTLTAHGWDDGMPLE